MRNSSYIIGVDGLGTYNAVDVARLASGNWWEVAGETCLGAYQAKGAADYSSSLVDLSGNGNTLTELATSPTWDTTNGWQWSSSSSQKLDTGIVPANGLASYTVLVRFSNQTYAGQRYILGSGWNFLLACDYGGSDGVWQMRNSSPAGYDHAVGTVSSGVVGFAGDAAYFDGSNVGTITDSSQSYSAGICIGGTSASGFSPNIYIQAVAIYSTTLDTTQMGNLTTAMAAL